MTNVQPPRFATWLLERLTPVERREAVSGDLLEQLYGGRSVWWYRRQAAAAIVVGLSASASFKLAAIKALATAWTWDGVRRELAQALRVLRRAPLLSATAALSIAIAVGVNAAVFGLAHDLLWTDLPVSRADELVRYRMIPSDVSFDTELPRTLTVDFGLTGPLFDALRARQRTSSDLFAWAATDTIAVRHRNGSAIAVTGAWASGAAFNLLGLSPAVGRLLQEEDDRPGGSWSANVSYRWWRTFFAGSPEIIGQTLRVDRQLVTIVGVLPPGFEGLLPGQRTDLVLPLASEAVMRGEHSLRQAPGAAWLLVMGRRRAGVSLSQSVAELNVLRPDVVNRAIPRELQQGDFKPMRLDVTSGRYGWSLHQIEYRRPLLIVQALGLLLAAVVCANVAGLLLARAAARHREFQVRRAIGAREGQLHGHLLAEGLLTTLVAAPVAALVAVAIRATVAPVLAEGRLLGSGFDIQAKADPLLIAMTLAGCVAAAFAAHAGPGFLLVRSSRSGRLRTVHDRVARGMTWLTPAQMAISFVLTAVAAVTALSLYALAEEPSGMARPDTVVVRPDLRDRPERGAARHILYESIVDSLRRQPGIDAVAIASTAPMQFEWSAANYSTTDSAPRRDSNLPDNVVGPGYFEALGVALLQGRTIGTEDRADTAPVCVINAAAARFFFAEQAIGKTLVRTARGAPVRRCTVIGVVANTRFWTLAQEPPRMVYRAVSQVPPGERTFLVHGRDRISVDTALKRVLEPLMPDRPLPLAVSLGRLMLSTIVIERVIAWLAAALAGLALALMAVSLFGQMTWEVNRRLYEFGVRTAIGATPAIIRRMVASRVGTTLCWGLGFGVIGTWAVSSSVSALVFHAAPLDARVLLATVTLVVVVVTTAVLRPCHRAVSVDPAKALRAE